VERIAAAGPDRSIGDSAGITEAGESERGGRGVIVAVRDGVRSGNGIGSRVACVGCHRFAGTHPRCFERGGVAERRTATHARAVAER
jgi:hypothetical protein